MPRVIPGNRRVVQTIAYANDANSTALATAMALAVNTFSPMSAGVHGPGTQPRGYSGVPGYGVNRAGNDVGALQQFATVVRPIRDPAGVRLGMGAGVSGQPGMPGTGADATGLAYLGLGQLAAPGMGA